MTSVVVLQPQFLPWVGVFEQIRLADVYVHLDNAQFPRGRSFASRVQIKSAKGSQWLTAPVLRGGRPVLKDVTFDAAQPWRRRHLRTLEIAYAKSAYRQDMIEVAQEILRVRTEHLADLNIAAIERIADYFGLTCNFVRASSLPVRATRSQRLIELVRAFSGDVYITGHGARHYLDHERFEAHGIRV